MLFVKSSVAGGVGTLVDFGVFFALTTGLGLDPQWANWPGMLAGGVVNFVGNRRFAFHAHHGNLTRQAWRFTGVTMVALLSSAVLFYFAVEAWPGVPPWVLRLITSNVVYLGWTFPLFRRVFHVHAVQAHSVAK